MPTARPRNDSALPVAKVAPVPSQMQALSVLSSADKSRTMSGVGGRVEMTCPRAFMGASTAQADGSKLYVGDGRRIDKASA